MHKYSHTKLCRLCKLLVNHILDRISSLNFEYNLKENIMHGISWML